MLLIFLPGLVVAATQGSNATSPAAWPPLMADVVEMALDDPQTALTMALARRKTAQEPTERFWRDLAVAYVSDLLELDDRATQAVDAAGAAMAEVPAPGPPMRHWLRLVQLSHAAMKGQHTEVLHGLSQLREEFTPLGPSILLCETIYTEAWMLFELNSLDESWLAAEALDRCGLGINSSLYRAHAATLMGQVRGASDRAPDTPTAVQALFDQALTLLQASPARFERSLVGFAAGVCLRELKQPEPAMRYLQQALALSRELNDGAGVAAAQIEIASILFDEGRYAEVLVPANEAMVELRRMQGTGAGRLLSAYTVRIRALAALGRPEVLGLIDEGRKVVERVSATFLRAEFSRAMAEGYASQRDYERAYREEVESQRLFDEARQLGQNIQVLRLQARYEATRRDAELATLRHREETARLTVAAQAATQRLLWLTVAAMGVAILAAGAAGARLLRRRRELAELALRDELTGLPNRRAIEAYGRAQFAQSRRLGNPLSVAVLDLDHFKQVNDRYGHPVGDQVLQALAKALTPQLRAQDRLGRWGGEEFMLVMPGTRKGELPMVYERLSRALTEAPVPSLPEPHRLSFSMGGTEADAATGSFDTLVTVADTRLYAAKAAGRATCR